MAMDVATTLKKLGVPYVTDLAYEEFSEFLASKKELAGARQAGVTIMDGYVPANVRQGLRFRLGRRGVQDYRPQRLSD